jgi:hypothetical protein
MMTTFGVRADDGFAENAVFRGIARLGADKATLDQKLDIISTFASFIKDAKMHLN